MVIDDFLKTSEIPYCCSSPTCNDRNCWCCWRSNSIKVLSNHNHIIPTKYFFLYQTGGNSGNTALNANKKKGWTSSKRPSGSAGEVFINIQRSNIFKIFTNSGSKKRRARCWNCEPCQAEDCGECAYCVDKPKFGRPNKKHQACVKRKCAAGGQIRFRYRAIIII